MRILLAGIDLDVHFLYAEIANLEREIRIAEDNTRDVKSRTGGRPLGRVTTDPHILPYYMICTSYIALRNKTQKPQTLWLIISYSIYRVQFWQLKWATKSKPIRRKPIPHV